MIRLLVTTTVSPSYDAIRIHRPLAWPGVKQALWDRNIHVETRPFSKITRASLEGVDCLVLHGVANPNLANILRALPCKFACFQDDLMRDVPAWNPHKPTPAQLRLLEDCLEKSVAIVATTDDLARQLGYPDKTHVQGNLEDFAERPGRSCDVSPAPAAAIFVGGNSHAGDLELLNDVTWPGKIVCWSHCLPSAWTTAYRNKLGNLVLKPNAENRGHIPTTPNYERYQLWLKALAPQFSIGLAPLVDCPFNRCKSILRFLEYTKCGWITIASHIPPYSSLPWHSCLFTGDVNGQQWTWDELLHSKPWRVQVADTAWEYCRKHHSYQSKWMDWVETYSYIASKI